MKSPRNRAREAALAQAGVGSIRPQEAVERKIAEIETILGADYAGAMLFIGLHGASGAAAAAAGGRCDDLGETIRAARLRLLQVTQAHEAGQFDIARDRKRAETLIAWTIAELLATASASGMDMPGAVLEIVRRGIKPPAGIVD